jgi:hypothetical protein
MEQCILCLHDLGEDRPKSELLCHHSFHTECLLTRIAQNFYRCPTCDQRYLQRNLFQDYDDDDPAHDIQQQTESERINTLFDTNPNFRKDIKLYRKKVVEASKSRRIFERYVRVKKELLKSFVEPLERQIQEYRNTKIEEIKNSQEYKTFVTKDRAVKAFFAKFPRTYRMDSFWYLRNKRGCKNLSTYRYRRSPQSLLRRNMRVRMFFW